MKKEKSKDEKSKGKKKEDGEKSEKSKSKGKDSKQASPSKKDVDAKSKKPKEAKEGKEGKESKGLKESPSQVSSISQQPVPPADCVHHKSPFINFCETCEELVCSQCTVYGPHNNNLHRILKMTDAFRLRKYYLVEAIRSNLVDKRDKIIAQLHRLEYRIEEIKFVKNIIQRDVRSEYAGILERLKSFQGIKLANLTHQVSLVQREIDIINDIGNKFFELTDMDCEKVEQDRKRSRFLGKSKEMYEAIEHIINKSEKVLPEIGINEMPREVQLTRELVKKATNGGQLNSMKNEIIWKLISDLKNEENTLRKEVDARAGEVIQQQSQEVEALNKKLTSFKMVCFYCGVRMLKETVNGQCLENNEAKPKQNLHKTAKTPEGKQLGNKRHFFARITEN